MLNQIVYPFWGHRGNWGKVLEAMHYWRGTQDSGQC